MEIAANRPAGAGVPAQPTPSASGLSSDFTTFLKMMTAQMKNQDPLNPLDSNDFATQLATFSGVEQQVRTNDLLGALNGQVSMMGVAQFAGWVGKEARTAAPVTFTGAPVELYPTADPSADRAELVVSDSSGREVQRLTLPVSGEPVLWGGVGTAGTPLPNGSYTFSLDSFSGDTLLGRQPVESYARVTEVRSDNGVLCLVLANGARIAASEVSGLRDPRPISE